MATKLQANITGCPTTDVPVGTDVNLVAVPTDQGGTYTYEWERLSPNPATFGVNNNPNFSFQVQPSSAGEILSFQVTVCEVATGVCGTSQPCTFTVMEEQSLSVSLTGCPTTNLNVNDTLAITANVSNAVGAITYTYERVQPNPNTFATSSDPNLTLNIAQRNAGETMIFQVEACDDNGCVMATCTFDVNPEVVNEDYVHPVLATELTGVPELKGCGVATTTGGRGGEVRFVTNLNDDGPGSFRQAVAGNTPKNVVFLVGGDIDITSATLVAGENTSIWGQTAPCEGVAVLAAQANSFGGEFCELMGNLISTHMRYRNRPSSNTLASRDTIRIGGSDIIFYRNSVSWSQDELVDANGSRQRILFRENLFYEGLQFSNTPSPPASYGFRTEGVQHTMQFNLWASSGGRNPRHMQNGYESANNWSHNRRFQAFHLLAPSRGNLINNLITRGPDSINNNDIQVNGNQSYISGNTDENGNPSNVNLNAGTLVNQPFTDCPAIDIIPTDQVMAYIVANSGAGQSIGKRDASDARVIAEAQALVGQIPDCVNGSLITPENNNCAKSVTYNGLQVCNSNSQIDTNQVDGVPNAWKVACGGAFLHGDNYDTTQQDSNGDGYTDFEDWIVDTFGL